MTEDTQRQRSILQEPLTLPQAVRSGSPVGMSGSGQSTRHEESDTKGGLHSSLNALLSLPGLWQDGMRLGVSKDMLQSSTTSVGWSVKEMMILIAKVRGEWRVPSIHIYWPA